MELGGALWDAKLRPESLTTCHGASGTVRAIRVADTPDRHVLANGALEAQAGTTISSGQAHADISSTTLARFVTARANVRGREVSPAKQLAPAGALRILRKGGRPDAGKDRCGPSHSRPGPDSLEHLPPRNLALGPLHTRPLRVEPTLGRMVGAVANGPPPARAVTCVRPHGSGDVLRVMDPAYAAEPG